MCWFALPMAHQPPIQLQLKTLTKQVEGWTFCNCETAFVPSVETLQ